MHMMRSNARYNASNSFISVHAPISQTCRFSSIPNNSPTRQFLRRSRIFVRPKMPHESHNPLHTASNPTQRCRGKYPRYWVAHGLNKHKWRSSSVNKWTIIVIHNTCKQGLAFDQTVDVSLLRFISVQLYEPECHFG